MPLLLATTGIQPVQGACEVEDLPVTEVDEVLSRECRSPPLVHRHREEIVFRLGLHHKRGDPARDLPQQVDG